MSSFRPALRRLLAHLSRQADLAALHAQTPLPRLAEYPLAQHRQVTR